MPGIGLKHKTVDAASCTAPCAGMAATILAERAPDDEVGIRSQQPRGIKVAKVGVSVQANKASAALRDKKKVRQGV